MEKYFFIIGNFRDFFSARQHIAYMHRALYAIARPSFRPSVRHRGGSEKNGWIMKCLPYGSPTPLRGKFHPEILRGSPSGGVKQGWGGKSAIC